MKKVPGRQSPVEGWNAVMKWNAGTGGSSHRVTCRSDANGPVTRPDSCNKTIALQRDIVLPLPRCWGEGLGEEAFRNDLPYFLAADG